MTDLAIHIKNVSKRYAIGKKKDTSLRGTLSNILKSAAGGKEDFWALKDINIKIEQGTVVGIIGKNGAGKSTLLKVLSQITGPTTGRIEINGRVASLLEVGTGFHPELTGRENIYLNGTILGMSRKEVKAKFDEIVAFSGVEKFIDTAVKHYSSGMYVRLAFAVAAHLEPEILIIDEVLAVGDLEFQKKCLGKMKDVANAGRTVLFVSHNIAAVKSLCDKGIVLKDGKVVFEGDQNEAVSFYLNMSEAAAKNQLDLEATIGNENIQVENIRVLAESGTKLVIDTPFSIEVKFRTALRNKTIGLSIFMVNEEEVIMFESYCQVTDKDASEGSYTVAFAFPESILNSGSYSIALLFTENLSEIIYDSGIALSFFMEDATYRDDGILRRLPGVIKPNFTTTIDFIPSTNDHTTTH